MRLLTCRQNALSGLFNTILAATNVLGDKACIFKLRTFVQTSCSCLEPQGYISSFPICYNSV